MTDQRSIVLKLPGVLNEFFLLESPCGIAFSSCVYKALDKANRVSVGLWVSRGPISPAVSVAFSERLEKMRVSLGGAEIRSFGVDAHGLAFAAIANLDGVKVTAEPADLHERERRYLMCVRAVEKLHAAGFVCGEICVDSFFITRSGVVRFIGVPGLLNTNVTVPDHELAQLLPFTQHGRVPTEASKVDDVYALLVLGYRLFAGVFPERVDSAFRSIKSFVPDAPAWLDAVITNLLAAPTTELPADAGALAERVRSFKEQQLVAQLAPSVVEPAKPEKPAAAPEAIAVRLTAPLGTERVLAEESTSNSSDGRQRRIVLMSLLLVFCAALFLDAREVYEGARRLIFGAQVPDVEPVDVAVVATDGSTEQQREQLKEFFDSEDPVAHDALIRRFRSASDADEKRFILDGLLARSERRGLVLAVGQARRWIESNATKAPAKVSDDRVLRMIDPVLPVSERVQMLNAAYTSDAKPSALMAAALALDLGHTEAYDELVKRAAREIDGIAQPNDHSLLAVLVVAPTFSSQFADLVLQKLDRVSDGDLVWLVEATASREGQENLAGSLLQQLMARQIVPGTRALFLKELEAGVNLPKPVQMSMISCALSGPNSGDIGNFGRWYSPASVNALLLVILHSGQPQLSELAFDALASKPIADPALSSLVDVVRASPGINKAQAARLAAIVGLQSKLSDNELTQGLSDLDVSGSLKPAVLTVLGSQAIRVNLELLHQYGVQMGSGVVVGMLQHSNPKVRIAALDALAKLGEGTFKSLALEHYLQEKDADVIETYKRYLNIEKR